MPAPRLSVSGLLDELQRRCPPGRTCWVGVDGLGGAGKSTLAALLALRSPGAVVVPVDHFARNGLTGWDRARFDGELVQPLRAGRTARYRRWDLDRDAAAERIEVPPGRTVIVEGVSATDDRLSVPWNLTVWVEAPESVRRARIEARDGARLEELWRTDWWPSEQAYRAAQCPEDRVDVLIDGSVAFG